MAIKKSEGDITIGTSAPAWMLTYSDLITQILIFFVMLFALAAQMNEMQLQRLKRSLDIYIKLQSLEKVVKLEINEKGLVISMKEKLMFDSGKADIHDEAKIIITNIMNTIMSTNAENPISIEGHTDNIPIKTTQFPSNWELSTSRATNVTKYIIDDLKFQTDRISSSGYGEYYPIVPNNSSDNRAINRRVDIIVKRLMGGKKKN